MRGEQEGAVDEEAAASFASAPVGEAYFSDGGALCGEKTGLDPLQLGPAGAEAPPRAVAQDPHTATLASTLLLLLFPGDRRRRRTDGDGAAERPVGPLYWFFGFVPSQRGDGAVD